jgi:hypothetical protein
LFAKAFILMFATLASFPTANAQSTSASKIPTVAYCDLLRNPDDYDGKKIRIRAEYNSGFEHSVFSDTACVKAWDTKRLVWVEFDEPVNANTKPKILKRFKDARFHEPINDRGEVDVEKWQREQWLNWYVDLTVIGEFRKSKDPDLGFGHTNAYPYTLLVSKIEGVGVLKKQ